jgi:mono/diheme cytochrome c family protein
VILDVQAADQPVADAMTADAPLADLGVLETGANDSLTIDAPAANGDAVDGGLSALATRGKYLVQNVVACSDCHTPNLSSGAPNMALYLAGNANFVKLPSGDAMGSPNLTPDKATGLGGFTAAQIKRMFMDGVLPSDGGTAALNPIMPYYVFHNMASEDADAIVAYLQSLQAISNPIPNRSATFDVSVPAEYLDPVTIPTPADSYPQKASALRGRYLAAESGLCIECHTQHLPPGPKTLDTSRFFQGGEDFSSFFAGTLKIHPVSANLTSDATTGLGDWTAEQIVTVLKLGKDDHGDGICPPMPVGPNGAYGGLTAQDALDIANYIKSLPPAVHDVPDICQWPPLPSVDAGGVDRPGIDGSGFDSASIESAGSG